MSAALGRIRERLTAGARTAPVVAFAVLAAVVLSVAIATRSGMLLQVTAVALAVSAMLLSLRWPLVPLFAFAALIPFEEVVVFADFGTLSRIAGLMFAAAYAIPRLGHIRLQAMPLPAWAFMGWAVLSLGWALDPSATLDSLGTLIQLFAIAVLVADVVVCRPTVVRPLFWAYSLSAALTAFIGIAADLGGATGVGGRVGAFQNQDVAYFAAVLLPAFVFGTLELRDRRLRPLGIMVASVTAAGILISGTRGAWLSVAVVMILLILPRFRFPQRLFALAAIVLVSAAALQIPGVAGFVAQRADSAISSGGAGRTDIWAVGIAIYESAPIAGVGFGNFPVAFTPEQILQSNLAANPGSARAPHSIVVGTLAELGWVGLILLALFLLPLILRSGWGPDAVVVQAALVSLLVAALFLDVLANRKQVWLLIGLAAGLAFLARRKGASTVQQSRPHSNMNAKGASLEFDPPAASSAV
jgi:O-antigen ligase